MSQPLNASRRRFLQQGGMGLLAASMAPTWLNAMEMGKIMSSPGNKANPDFKADVELNLLAQHSEVSILPGTATRVFRYTAQLIRGPKDSIVEIPGSYLGPILQFHKGQKVRIHFQNQLPEPSITHWHGLHVPSEQDGHPMHAVVKGDTRVYEFEVLNRAGLNIYHPHPHGATASQVYYGLAGGLLVRDQEEARHDLPSGEFEVPIVIQDRRFDGNNQLVYSSTMHDRTIGFYGDRILVNGKLPSTLDVASRAYRFRILNGSNARIYKLAWSDGTPVTLIGVDGGLLEVPEHRPYVMIAPGERLDVWMDFTGRSLGSRLSLKSLTFKGVLPKMAENMMGGGMQHGGMGGMAGMMGGAIPVGSEYDILSIRIAREVDSGSKLPSQLSTYPHYQVEDTANAGKPVPIGVSEGPGSMLLNGRPYAFNDVQPNERIPLNSLQLLEIFHAHGGGGGHGGEASQAPMEHGGEKTPSASGEHNMAGMKASEGGGMGMGGMNMGGMGMMGGNMGMMFSMAHPIHLHGQQFQVISRSSEGTDPADYATVKEGLVSSGLKDTVLLMPGEKIHIIKPFQDFKGLFMYHCHNLEHEDLGMMREFSVE